MEKTREARRSATMAASNGVSKRRQRISENSRAQMVTVRDRHEKKERDPESLNRSKRRRSERFAPRNERDSVEEDSSDESLRDDDVQHHNYRRKSFPSGRILRHAASLTVADEMIGVPVPRKARSACIKRSHDCRTSSGSYSFEVVSPSSSTVSVKQKKNVNGSKSQIPKPPKSSATIEDDLEIEIAEVLSGLKKQSHTSKREDDSENSLKSSEVKDSKKLKTEGDDDSSTDKYTENPEKSVGLTPDTHRTNGAETTKASSDIQKEKETPSVFDGVEENQRLDLFMSKGVPEGPGLLGNNRDESNCSSKLEIDLMVPQAMPTSPQRVSLLPLVSDSIVTNSKDYCKQVSSVKSGENVSVQNEMTPVEVKQKNVETRQLLNLDLEKPSQETVRDSSLRLQSLDWSQHQQAKSAQQSSVSPLPVAVGGWPTGLPPQGYVPLIQTGKSVEGSNGSSTVVMQGAPFFASQPMPKRCATHFFIARNIQLHQHFVKTNHLSQPNKDYVYVKCGDLRPAAGNQLVQGSSSMLSLNSQPKDVTADNISAPKDMALQSSHFASTRQKKPQPPTASSNIVPPPAFIFPTNHHMQPVMVPSKSLRPTKNPCAAVGSGSVNFSHPSSPAGKASSPYLTVLPNNAYSFQLPSTIRGGTPTQALPFFNGSFYSQQMYQPPQLPQKQSQVQRETKASSCFSSSSHRQPQVSVNSLSSQANVQKHRHQSQKSEIKAAGDNSDSRGSHTQKGVTYGQIMTAPVQPHNFSMSFATFAGGSAPANLNFSSSGYHIVPGPPIHQKNHPASDSKTGGGSCSSNAEDLKKTFPGKPPVMMNGQTLVFDNPSRTLNFVSGTWPPPAATPINGDPSVFTQHFTQRPQQSNWSKPMTHSQADSIPATPPQWRNPANSSPTSFNSLNLKQFQSQQQIRAHGQTQISFAAPSKSQPFQGQQGRSVSSSSIVQGSAQHGKAANSKVGNSKPLPLSPVPSSAAHAQDQTENSASGSTQKTSPVCRRTVPPIITSCPGHISELKY